MIVAFAERELPDWLKKGQQPIQAVAKLLIRHRDALAAARKETEAARRRAEELAEVLGLALYRKHAAHNASEFRVLFDALRVAGIESITHVGEPFAGELEESADVMDWVDAADGIGAGCVAEAFEPEIRIDGRLAHRAKLICVKEAPPNDGPPDPRTVTHPGPIDDPSDPPFEVSAVPGQHIETRSES